MKIGQTVRFVFLNVNWQGIILNIQHRGPHSWLLVGVFGYAGMFEVRSDMAVAQQESTA